MTRRPAFWLLLAVVSAAAAVIGFSYFPQAFSIVALDITMDRDRALAEARTIAARDQLGPPNAREAASFGLDDQTQTFVELEGGGKEAFTQMTRDGLYSAYTWRVRRFAEGQANETTIQFTPDGRPYGFGERLDEKAPGAALPAAQARSLGEAAARDRWRADFTKYALVEQGQERRPSGRVDHTFTYERPSPTLNEGRYRLQLVVSGDRLTALRYFVRIPEAFSRRYENMRSANEAIGVASAVGMVLLYVFGGIGVGLFFMLRRRMVVWRPAVVWGVAVAFLQALAAINEWPLIWMAYDTAVPRTTFFLQQVATVGVTFLGFSAFFALSFMAAETLGRAAFGHHPQMWRAWSRGPGSSTAVLGQTVSGYLLVSAFFAYDVLLYLITTKAFGWWSPAEALLHPDVLATYAPWLSAIANSFQAGFWEECLFRAVPLAGAALIGDRFGQRRLFLVIAFVVQALVFGAGHAPYPNQPSFARPLELIVPSVGFGLLYIYFGLIPGIVLHFAFDVVWFALPVFIAAAPGIRFQQFMIVALTLVPLWVLLWRRYQAGQWTTLAPDDRNAAWIPPPAPPVREAAAAPPRSAAIAARARRIWLTAGAVALVVVLALMLRAPRAPMFTASRAQATEGARQALAARNVTLTPQWRWLPIIDDGSGGPHEFVSRTAGETRRVELLGRYLPVPRWRVRVATFEGDLAERAEEWSAVVDGAGVPQHLEHTLPQSRVGASLDESAARAVAGDALRARTQLDAARGQAREVSARPEKLAARTDWTFTFADTTIAPLPQGEARIDVRVAGDEVVAVRRYVFVPEDWERQERAAGTRSVIVRILAGILFGGLLLAAAIIGVILWSRRHYSPLVFLLGATLMLVAAVANGANGFPALMAALSTAQPLPLQLGAVAGVGLVGLGLTAVLVGLALGAFPRTLATLPRLPDREALALGLATGAMAAAVGAASSWLRTPPWAPTADLTPLTSFVPSADLMIDPIPGFLTRLAVLLALFVGVDRVTRGWTRLRPLAAAGLFVVGVLASGPPAGGAVSAWLLAAAVTGAALAGLYSGLLRFDLSMIPLALGASGAIGALARGWQRPFPGALPASLVAAIVVFALGWLWFRVLRQHPVVAA
ncbi:MAG: type II CAAX endopeptidase family protein [Vicinamibacterales bacterium]